MADGYWLHVLEGRNDVVLQNISLSLAPSVCDLVNGVLAEPVVSGLVQYENARVGDRAYTLPMALTIAAQDSLIPVTPAMLEDYSCLRAHYDIKVDLTKMPEMVSLSIFFC